MAEASINPAFKKHRLIQDDVEGGSLMNLSHYFGKRMAKRLESRQSSTIEEFYDGLDELLAADESFIYILDSMDSLSSEGEQKKVLEQKKARRSGKESKGSFTDNKAKINSNRLRFVVSQLIKTNSILIIVGQTRDNLDAGLFGPQKTRSGGHALTFYATTEIWSSVRKQIKKKVGNVDWSQGIMCKCAVRKNRQQGQKNVVWFPIYDAMGIDDVGGMISWLVDVGRWKKSKSGIIECGDDFELKARLKPLAEKFRTLEWVDDLKFVVEDAWRAVQSKVSENRSPVYE